MDMGLGGTCERQAGRTFGVPCGIGLCGVAWCLAGALVFVLPSGRAAAQEQPSTALKQADADYRAGVLALDRGDLAAAQGLFASVVRLAPGAEQGHSALGAVLVREGQFSLGIAELTRALAMAPKDHSAEENLALAYEQTGAYRRALPLFAQDEAAAQAAHRRLPAGVLEAYARALGASGQLGLAAAKMEAAVAEAPTNAELEDGLGSLEALGRNWSAAEAAFTRAIALRPDYALAHLHLGSVMAAEEKPGASGEWLEAAQLAPRDAGIQLSAGMALGAAGADEQALPLLEAAHALAPNSAQASYQLGLVLQQLNHVDEAIPLLESVVRAEPKNADALVNLGMGYTQEQRAKEGVPLLQRAIALAPKNAMAHQDLAAAFIQLNQVEDAVGELKAALQLAPESPQLHYNLGLAYKMEDNATAAIPELEAAEKLDASAYEPAYVLGLLYMQVARYSEAAPELERALKLHPDNGEGWSTLGNVYRKLGELAQAEAALKEAIRQLPERSDPRLILAEVLVSENKPAEAAMERKAAASLMRAHMNQQRAEVATHSGESLLAAGKLDDAAVEFKNAIGFDAEYAEAHRGLAKVYQKQGRMTEAAVEASLGAKSHATE